MVFIDSGSVTLVSELHSKPYLAMAVTGSPSMVYGISMVVVFESHPKISI